MSPIACLCPRAALCILLVAAAAASARVDQFDAAVDRYRAVLIDDIGKSLAGARRLHDCVVASDAAGAKAAWLSARAGWERSEVFTAGFVPALDKDIDAWPDAVKGFHAIEAQLFGANKTDVADQTRALVLNLEQLDRELRDMALAPQGLLNGIVRLAYEVGDSKADGGESRVSGTSLDDMRNNVDGIEIAYLTMFAPTVAAHDARIDAEVKRRIGELKEIVAVPDLRRVDADRLRTLSEELVVTLQNAAPALGLRKPTLEENN